MATTTITAAADIEDTYIVSSLVNNNYGVTTGVSSGATGTPRAKGLFRLGGALYPAGSISGFRLIGYCYSAPASPALLIAHVVDAANDWVEGTKNSATAGTGETSYNYVAYNTQTWAGSPGCSTAGTDYTADAGDPTWQWETGVGFTATLPPSWATNWRDAVWTNNGFVVMGDTGSSGNAAVYSSDSGTSPLYFEIDASSGVSAYIQRPSAFNPRSIICR